MAQGIAGGVSYVVLRFVFGLEWWIAFPLAMVIAGIVFAIAGGGRGKDSEDG